MPSHTNEAPRSPGPSEDPRQGSQAQLPSLGSWDVGIVGVLEQELRGFRGFEGLGFSTPRVGMLEV